MRFVPTSITRSVGNQVLSLKKNSPNIMFVGGIAAVLGGTFLACRATLKLEDTLDEIRNDVDDVKKLQRPEESSSAYPDEEYSKDLLYVYALGGYNLMKLYGPSIVLTSAGIAALTGSHRTLTQRNASLTAAYAVVTEALDSYRKRVREELGEEKELDLYLSRTKVAEVNEETKELEEHYVVDPNTLSPYARLFDETSSSFQKNAEMNRLFIQCQQNYANNILQARGHLFLNEVYDMLGMERSSAGQVVGWVISDTGDNYVDFGMFEARNAHFISAWEPRVFLDFNVDGVIWDKIGG